MKKLLILLLLVCLVSVGYTQKREPMNGQFIKAQFNEIKNTLMLDDKTVRELEPIYITFMEELHPKRAEKDFIPLQSDNEDRIEKQTRARLAMAVHIATVREKYYDIFRKYLSPSQIVNMYKTEKEIMRKVHQESGLRRGGKDKNE